MAFQLHKGVLYQLPCYSTSYAHLRKQVFGYVLTLTPVCTECCHPRGSDFAYLTVSVQLPLFGAVCGNLFAGSDNMSKIGIA